MLWLEILEIFSLLSLERQGIHCFGDQGLQKQPQSNKKEYKEYFLCEMIE